MSATDDLPTRSVRLTFDDPSCLRPLRRAIREMIEGADEDKAVDAELVATELVANSLEHAAGPRSVEVTLTGGGQLHITVVDGSPDAPLTVGVSRLGSHRGRGLAILDATARWHVTRTATSKAVWAVLQVRMPGVIGGGPATA